MMEIVMAVCLIDSPYACKRERLPFEQPAITTSLCSMFAQTEMARWIGENPNWTVRRWTCSSNARFANL